MRALRRPPRPSFVVVTIATAAVSLQGCGVLADDATPCPTNQPAFGASCEGGNVCKYEERCGGYPGDTTYECKGGKWERTQSVSCNPPPPPPVCPPVRPAVGSACAPYSPLACLYADNCPDRPTRPSSDAFRCTGTWTLDTTYASKCPGSEPRSGDSCECALHLPKVCTYSFCGIPEAITATCDAATARWIVTSFSCNPPFDAGPPAEAGTDAGDAGDGGEGGT